MRTFLNINKTVIEGKYLNDAMKRALEDQQYPSGCNSDNLIIYNEPTELLPGLVNINRDSYHLNKGEFKCLYSYESFIALGDGLTIEGVTLANDDKNRVKPNTVIEAKQNAWGGSVGIFKIEATKETDLNIYHNITSSWEEGEIDHKVYIILKQNWNGAITAAVVDHFGIVQYAAILNPNTYNIEVSSSNKGRVAYQDPNDNRGTTKISSGVNYRTSGIDYSFTHFNEDFYDGSDYQIRISIQSNSVPQFFPNKIIQLVPGEIYDDKTAETDLSIPNDDDKGLSAGIIALIVIIIIIVLAIVIIGVYYFIKKRKESANVQTENITNLI